MKKKRIKENGMEKKMPFFLDRIVSVIIWRDLSPLAIHDCNLYDNQMIHEVWLVLTDDLLEDRHIVDVTVNSILLDHQIRQR